MLNCVTLEYTLCSREDNVISPCYNSMITLPYPKYFTLKNLQILISGSDCSKISFTCCHIRSQELNLSSVTHNIFPLLLMIEIYKTWSPSLYPLRNSFSNSWISYFRNGLTKGNDSKWHIGMDKRDLERGQIRKPLMTELKFIFFNFIIYASSMSVSAKMLPYIFTTKSKRIISEKIMQQIIIHSTTKCTL